MRFVTDYGKGILGKPDSPEMWNNIISYIPDAVLLKKDIKILCVAFGHGTEADVIVKRMIALGRTSQEVKNSIYLLDKYSVFTKDAIRKGYTNVIKADFLEWNTSTKFDVIVGAPPFQDGAKSGGQNKVYNFFAKKSLELLDDNGMLLFITPTSVLKRSKRFSVIGLPGLKYVDFTANNYFDTGVKICSWVVDKTYVGNVTVKCAVSTDSITINSVIYDYSEIDKKFGKLYEALRKFTKDSNNRMFKHNSIDMSKCRSAVQDEVFQYPIYKLNSDGSSTICQYNSVKPKLHGKRSLTVAISKKFDESMTADNDLDYDMTNISTPVTSDIEIENIKSFLFSDYFRNHVAQWKKVDGYGWNYATLYLPVFDKTKKWTSEEVKTFLEDFIK